jgi:hypothetical protein
MKFKKSNLDADGDIAFLAMVFCPAAETSAFGDSARRCGHQPVVSGVIAGVRNPPETAIQLLQMNFINLRCRCGDLPVKLVSCIKALLLRGRIDLAKLGCLGSPLAERRPKVGISAKARHHAQTPKNAGLLCGSTCQR